MTLGRELWRRVRNPRWLRDDIAHVRASLAWSTHPDARASRDHLRALHNRYAGQRAFIVGNGPSLAGMDLSPLRNEQSFGLNRVYLAFPDWGFETNFYVSVNDLVIQQCADDISRLTMPRFISWRARRWVPLGGDMAYLHGVRSHRFEIDAANGVWEGATVTFVAMQVAYYLGFSQVYLIGVDHHFETQGPPHEVVVSRADDRDHFHPDYFGAGFRWNLPDLETSEAAYRLAKAAYARDGRVIYNATAGGRLEVFERRDFDSLFT